MVFRISGCLAIYRQVFGGCAQNFKRYGGSGSRNGGHSLCHIRYPFGLCRTPLWQKKDNSYMPFGDIDSHPSPIFSQMDYRWSIKFLKVGLILGDHVSFRDFLGINNNKLFPYAMADGRMGHNRNLHRPLLYRKSSCGYSRPCIDGRHNRYFRIPGNIPLLYNLYDLRSCNNG
ncbi:MAG: hypothetical protein BWX44_00705 [Spirochaetes bacterium ADurb.Bin001]|nr:MAG: hypothetical protein BWX44_00705 [Spirochaetes bacterium ADurb.Bin001]